MVAGLNSVDGIGCLGALITLGTYSMKRMIPLRIYRHVCQLHVHDVWSA
jgi:hypothetical protein